jgi:MarR family transcriptional regulator, 2-MHQ and catechol-resistance regulon repressor
MELPDASGFKHPVHYQRREIIIGTGSPNGSGPRESGSGPADAERGAREEEALRLWIALARSYQTMTRLVSSRVVAHGLTLPQFGILEALHLLGPLSLGELAEKLLVTGGNITYVMDRLEEQGLVYRQRSDLDRRVIEARLTDEGSALIEHVYPDHADHVRELMSHLDPDEQRNLRDLLKRLGKGVSAPPLTPGEIVLGAGDG